MMVLDHFYWHEFILVKYIDIVHCKYHLGNYSCSKGCVSSLPWHRNGFLKGKQNIFWGLQQNTTYKYVTLK